MFQNIHFGKTSVVVGLCALATTFLYIWGLSYLNNIAGFLPEAVSITSIVLAFVAISAAVVSFLKTGDRRYSGVGVALSLLAIVFHFILIALVIVFLVLIIMAIANGGG
ncbi:hypothetical protein [Aurantivibrio plasticivorans]